MATCPDDHFKSAGDICRAAHDLCDVPESCPDSIGTKCPADLRKDYGYSLKCGLACYVCAVPNQATLVNAKSDSYVLQGCTVGACSSSWFTDLGWPGCASQCIPSICKNGKALSNYELYTCNPNTGIFSCVNKVDGNVGTCSPPPV